MKNISRMLREARKSPEPPHCPDLGEIIALDFSPQAGREQAGIRPALVLTPKRYNALTRLCIACPVTSRVKDYPFAVPVPPGIALPPGIGLLDGAALDNLCGVVLSDQAKSVSWHERGAMRLAQAPPELLADVRARLSALLGLV
ncbi:type II toxin-antitoxin system PemK/MazF family toxin [Methylobacterium indicum]|uniref:type II toxin-antitoxin system PemK/MazF family toxin n=2 Tax=Methylobacterium indicum TaxID=1775910 RepID=UPI000AB3ADE1